MKILAIDIETSPALVYTWGLWDQNINVEAIVDTGGVICFAAKWLGEDETEFRSVYHGTQRKMISRLWTLLDEADVVMHYNGKRFDVPHIQREFLELDMLPPSPFKQIDLYVTIKNQFHFLSNKFAFVSEQLGLDGKVKHEGFRLWLNCMERDKEAWERMRAYNIRDTLLLEQAYAVLRPWIKSHPSIAAQSGENVCPKCGSDDLESRGFTFLQTGRYRRYHCRNCGSWTRSTKRYDGVTVTEAT